MPNILSLIIFAIMTILGAGSSLAIIGYMVLILMQKIYRKIKFGNSLYQ